MILRDPQTVNKALPNAMQALAMRLAAKQNMQTLQRGGPLRYPVMHQRQQVPEGLFEGPPRRGGYPYRARPSYGQNPTRI